MKPVRDTVNTVYSDLNKFKNSKQYSTKEVRRIFENLQDIIPDDGYTGFYVNKLKEIGLERFMELAAKARKGSDKPAVLFAWMLKNHKDVK